MKTKIYLAPMAGVADYVFRSICSEYGEIITFTEMISAKAIYYNDKKTLSLLPKPDEGKIPLQIFGHEPEILAFAAKKLQDYASEININMGCPMPKIVNNKDGSFLMKTPAIACDIIKAVKDAVDIPVTAKIRKGYTEDTSADFAKALEQSGIDKIYVHARTTDQLYSGKADIECIKRVKESVKVPVIGNGDIFTSLDASRMLEKTSCDAVMIGRGALGNPFIFREIIHYLETGSPLPPATKEERIEKAVMHLKKAAEVNGERMGLLESRKHLAWYLKTIPNSAKAKEKLFTCLSLDEAINYLKTLL
ncbi:MAG: tRNA dihydrouridine synthase DusB [Bacillota bacterium]|nr:tRNA dihydrouridine synthase DusB [Bacillota bacterium]